jgi:glycosyltransferase involved in cell wall biosynthesis
VIASIVVAGLFKFLIPAASLLRSARRLVPARAAAAGAERADALVLPSVAEAFGLVLVEAMACGLPVIACRAHGPAAIVTDRSTGWLIPPDDEDALIDSLVAAATNQQERRTRGRRAQGDRRRYDWAEVALRLPLRRTARCGEAGSAKRRARQRVARIPNA